MSTFEEFKQKFKGDIVDPTSQDYEAAIDRWAINAIRRARDEEDISEALKYLVGNNIPLAVKGGGHNPSGASSIDDGVVIDLSRYINYANVDPESKTIDVGGGALWGAVDDAAIVHGLATVGGTMSETGVAGLALGGGHGVLSSKHGQAVDSILEMTVVLADSSIVSASKTSHPDLFWALRGGGGNFGIVSRFKLQLYPQRKTVYGGFLFFAPTQLDQVIAAFDQWLPTINEDQFTGLGFGRGPGRSPAVLMVLFHNGTVEEGRLKYKPFFDVGPVADMTQEMPYPAINKLLNAQSTLKRCYYMFGTSLRSSVAAHGAKLFERAMALSEQPTDESKQPFDITIIYEVASLNKILSVSPDDMAFRSRGKQNHVLINISWDKHVPGDVDEARTISRELSSIVESTAVEEVKENENEGYGNYVTHTADLKTKALKLWGNNYPRLQKIKKQYDPKNIFNRWIPIEPAFLQLPEEILISVIEKLTLKDILRISETCQSLYKLIGTSAAIRYQIEINVSGVVDGESSLPKADRLAILKRAERNWSTVQFARTETLKRRPGNLWELYGGMLAFSISPSDAPPNSRIYQGLTFIELPSAVRGTTSKVHHLEDLDYNIRDFGMDPSQDLLVLIERTQEALGGYSINLLTISNGKPHPMAAGSILSSFNQHPETQYSFVVQIMGDYLGLLFHTPTHGEFHDQFLLWNWKTSRRILFLGPCQHHVRYDSFSFISSNHFVVSRVQLIPEPDVTPSLQVYEFSESNNETIVNPDPYRIFELPPLYGSAIAASFVTRSDPSPNCLGILPNGQPRPFTTSPKSRLFTACLGLIRDFTDVLYVMLFIHQESFLSDQLPSQPSNLFPWDVWGPQYSRMLVLEHYEPVWVCYVHGMRFVRGIRLVNRETLPRTITSRLQILDFNPLSIRRNEDYGEQNVEIVDQESVISPRGFRIFANEVSTSLPFRRSTSLQTYPHTDFMIDEDVVVGLNRSSSEVEVSLQSPVVSEDSDGILEELGLHRELKRKFSKFTTISFAMGIMGTAASITSTANTPLLLGGPAATIWAWLLGAVELVSAYPTAGGIYTTTMFVVPSRYRSSVCFISAWITIVGQLATTASVNFALAEMILAAVTIGSNGSFVATPQQTYGLYAGINVLIGAINSLPTSFLHKISMGYVFVNLLATFSVIIGILIGGRHDLAPSTFVWTSIIDQSGWNNRGFVFLLGLLSVQWVMTDYDAAAHLAEETVNAAEATPLAIMVGSITTAILGFFVNVALCYGIKDITNLPGPTGLVVPQILWDNMGQTGGLVVFSFIIIVQTVVAMTCQLSSIRSIYAISRDNGLPDKKLLAKVWNRTRTPVNAAIFVVIVETLFGLLSLASAVAPVRSWQVYAERRGYGIACIGYVELSFSFKVGHSLNMPSRKQHRYYQGADLSSHHTQSHSDYTDSKNSLGEKL
ncbi:hypothetical protein Clacol_004130 [Clathrus columnatus]|uniref:F-box domain-containing protein n=1 Tax=Clathrus columnatus TaxID=1419009 RepID=A0AAV5ABQ5_9AGAM|nr:hypothetical protein Clacol_004130 [Clathrus columnatus]